MKNRRTRLRCRAVLLAVAGAWLAALAVGGMFAPGAFAATKSVTGKLRAVEEKVLTIEGKKLLQTTSVAVEIDSNTKITGELVPGMMIKVKYREVSDPRGTASGGPAQKGASVRRIAVQVKTWPEFSSRRDRKAAPDTQP